jgi:ribosome-binding factor A
VKRRTATYPRALRVNQVLRQVLAEELERLADADELPMITVTSVEVASDMRTAVVYLASLNDETAVVLEDHRGHLQRTVGTQMTMKRTPRLSFRADPAIAAGSRVEELLRGLHGGRHGEASEDRAGGAAGAGGEAGAGPGGEAAVARPDEEPETGAGGGETPYGAR